MKILTIANNKGGTGKTTLTLNIAGVFSKKGRVLVVDLDAQLNTTSVLKGENVNGSLYDVLIKNEKLEAVISASRYENLDVLLGSEKMNEMNMKAKYRQFLTNIEGLRGRYDYVIFDTSPFFDFKVREAIGISDLVIIPSICDKFSVQGIMKTVSLCEEEFASNGGEVLIVPVYVVHNSKLHKEVIGQIRRYADGKENVNVSNVIISNTVTVSNNFAKNKINTLDVRFKDKVTKQLHNLGKEVLTYV